MYETTIEVFTLSLSHYKVKLRNLRRLEIQGSIYYYTRLPKIDILHLSAVVDEII